MALTFGYVLPPSTGADVPSPEQLWPVVEAADRSSLDHLWVSDHIVWWHPMHDCLTLLAAVAARTERIRIGTAVLLLALRNPVLAAKALASVERLSSGRLTVGVGVGGEFPPEWDAVGVPRKARGARVDASIDSLRELWGDEGWTTDSHLGIDLHPKPTKTPPIWIGGRSDAALRRAAQKGDGWMGIFLTPERYRSSLESLNSLMTGMRGMPGMPRTRPGPLKPSLYAWTCVARTDEQAREQASSLLGAFYNLPFEKLERFAIVGSPETCAKRILEFADAGVEDFVIAPITATIDTQMLELLTNEVIPAVIT